MSTALQQAIGKQLAFRLLQCFASLLFSFPSQIFQHSQHFPTTRGSTIAAWCWPVCRWSCKMLGHWRYHGATACWDLDRKSQLLGAGLPCILGAWFSWQNIYNVQCVLVYYHLLLLMMMMIIIFTITVLYIIVIYYSFFTMFFTCLLLLLFITYGLLYIYYLSCII